jgi:hypothetical protein
MCSRTITKTQELNINNIIFINLKKLSMKDVSYNNRILLYKIVVTRMLPNMGNNFIVYNIYVIRILYGYWGTYGYL